MQSILIIDDEADIRDMLAGIFEDEGYQVHKAAHSEQAYAIIKENDIDLIILDIWLDNSDMDGMQILKHLKIEQKRSVPILMISGHGNVEMAVNAMKIGAFDYIAKPAKIDHILLTVQRALEQKKLVEENARLKGGNFDTETTEKTEYSSTHYKSTAMSILTKQIEEHADSDARILICGERGVGKTRIAAMIYRLSSRSRGELEVVSSSVMTTTDSLEKAISAANNGTLLLEDIEMLPKDLQQHLGKVLNQQTLECRLITTCSPDIRDYIKNGLFSSSLYDRLAVLCFDMPSLNHRRDDINQLIEEFRQAIALEFNIKPRPLSRDVINILKEYDWSAGNIRQLKIAVEWIFLTTVHTGKETDEIKMQEISFVCGSDSRLIEREDNAFNSIEAFLSLPLKQARESFEKAYLQQMIKRFDGNVATTAERIDMERTALYRKLKSMNISYENDNIVEAKQS